MLSMLTLLKNHNNRIINSVGPRYTKELNIQTEYINYFEPLLRTQKFKNEILKNTGKLERTFDDIIKSTNKSDPQIDATKIDTLQGVHSLVIPLLYNIARKEEFPTQKITDLLKEYETILNEIQWVIRKLSDDNDTNDLAYKYRKHNDALSQIYSLVRSNESQLFNKNILWLNGDAGEGKTHLLCDIATQRMKEKKPTIIMVGTDFNSSKNIWKTFCRHLDLDTSKPKENFINFINSLHKEFNHRVLLLIDAINEGEGINIWKKQLGTFVRSMSKNKSVAVCLSCRTTYEFFFDLDEIDDQILKFTHQGFKSSLTKAVKEYFRHYKIKYHEVPLVTEFSNPLFLQVYCKTLSKEKSQSPYRGHKGMKDIIEKYFFQIDRSIISPKLNYPKTIKPSWDLAKLIAKHMANVATDFITLEDAANLESLIIAKKGIKSGLIQEMIREGLLIKDGHFEVNGEVIRFAYQKFSDHLITRYLLNKYLKKDPTSKKHSLDLESEELQNIFDKPYIYQGLIDAMSAQVPERTKGVDLIELSPPNHRHRYYESYLDSLIWRSPSTITDINIVIKYFNEMLSHHFDQYNPAILTTLISLSTVPNHPLNAHFLSTLLSKKTMPKRDNIWSTFINTDFQEENSITQLVISWGWDDMDSSATQHESINLLSLCLCWFFTASNRFLRDRATKALTRVLTESISISKFLIDTFINSDDPYILERIVTSIYGAIIRTSDKKEIETICRHIYKKIFLERKPENIVTLYYAKQILKFAQNKKCALKFVNWTNTISPFGFSLPKNLPKLDSIKKKYEITTENSIDRRWGLSEIESSVLDMGDFGRYVIGTDQGYIDWSDSTRPSRKSIEQKFYNNLRKDLKPIYESIAESAPTYQKFKSGKIHSKTTSKHIPSWIKIYETLEKEFIALLPPTKKDIYTKVIIPYIRNKDAYQLENQIKTDFLQRYILWRILKLGYKSELFGNHDRHLNYYDAGRNGDKPERIGKKYQWIAYFEILAIIADNYSYNPRYDFAETPQEILDLRQFHYADQIDPTVLIRSQNDRPILERIKNIKFKASNINTNIENIEWLRETKNNYDISSLINILDENQEEWLFLRGMYDFSEDIPPEEDRYSKKRKRQWYIINSYLYKLEDEEKVKKFIESTNFIGRWMPENSDWIDPHFGEFGWSDYYQHLISDMDWESSNKIPFPWKHTNESYLYERGVYDCSIDETISFYLPSHTLMNGMNLGFGKIDGQYVNHKAEVVSFDLSKSPRGLLISKNDILSYLKKNKLGIFWTLISEKDLIGGTFHREEWLGRLEISQGMSLTSTTSKIAKPIISFRDP